MRAAATIEWDGFEIGSAAIDSGQGPCGGTNDETRISADPLSGSRYRARLRSGRARRLASAREPAAPSHVARDSARSAVRDGGELPEVVRRGVGRSVELTLVAPLLSI